MKEDFLFEDFLKEKAENFRLRPSEKVWGHIQSSIRPERKLLFRYILIVFWTVLFLNFYLPLKEMNNNHAFKLSNGSEKIHASKPYKNSISRFPLMQDTKNNIINGPDIIAIHNSVPASKQRTSLHYHNDILIVAPQEPGSENRSVLPRLDDNSIGNRFHGATNQIKKEINTGSALVIQNKDYKMMDKIKDKLKKITYNNSWQFYFTPSVSYRVLYIDNRPYFRNNGAGIESSVSHYPATGLETGISLLKPLSKRWKIKGGVQFNFSRYNINASKINTELVYVTLTQDEGFERNTNIRNGGGILPKKLMNENLQISLPIGMEFMAAGDEKLSFNIAGTIQPGMSLYAGGYMVTTNYKSYIPADNLFRRYNMQTGIELFVKTNIGMLDLQAGPQLRYQILSNTIGAYPVKEHLIDYGFKIGIVKKIQ